MSQSDLHKSNMQLQFSFTIRIVTTVPRRNFQCLRHIKQMQLLSISMYAHHRRLDDMVNLTEISIPAPVYIDKYRS